MPRWMTRRNRPARTQRSYTSHAEKSESDDITTTAPRRRPKRSMSSIAFETPLMIAASPLPGLPPWSRSLTPDTLSASTSRSERQYRLLSRGLCLQRRGLHVARAFSPRPHPFHSRSKNLETVTVRQEEPLAQIIFDGTYQCLRPLLILHGHVLYVPKSHYFVRGSRRSVHSGGNSEARSVLESVAARSHTPAVITPDTIREGASTGECASRMEMRLFAPRYGGPRRRPPPTSRTSGCGSGAAVQPLCLRQFACCA